MKSLLFCLLSSVTMYATAPDGLGDNTAQPDLSLVVRMSDLGIEANTLQQNGISTLSDQPMTYGSAEFSTYSSPVTGNSSAWAQFDRRKPHDDDDDCHPSPVPEPATYGFILTSMTLGAFVWKKRKQKA